MRLVCFLGCQDAAEANSSDSHSCSTGSFISHRLVGDDLSSCSSAAEAAAVATIAMTEQKCDETVTAPQGQQQRQQRQQLISGSSTGTRVKKHVYRNTCEETRVQKHV